MTLMTLSVLIMPSADKLPIVRQPFHKPPSESGRVTRDTSQCLASRGEEGLETIHSYRDLCLSSVHGHAADRRVGQY